MLEDKLQHALDDALLDVGKVAAFHAHVETPVTAEQVVDHQEDQVGVEHEQRRTAQRLDVHEVERGRHHQVADELAVLLHLHRTDGDLRVAPHEVEQPDAPVAREPLVDDFQRRHAPTDDALLRPEVVRADA